MDIQVTEEYIRKLIKEALDKDVIKENEMMNKYYIYYISNGDSPYDGHYLDTLYCKNDKEVLKKFLNEFLNSYKYRLSDDPSTKERHVIGIADPEDDDLYDIVYDIEFYSKNGKTPEYKYSYQQGGNWVFFDSFTERNKKNYYGYISDIMGRKLKDIPMGYCSNISTIKNYVKSYIKKNMMGNSENDYAYVNVFNEKTGEWEKYYGMIMTFGDNEEFYFKAE